MTTIVSIAQGGTGARTAANARIALDVPPSAAYDQANTARTQANTAYGQANTAYGQANAAYGQANAAYGAANTRLSASGGTLSGDLIITGNLTVSGNSTTLNTEILTVEDADVVLLSNVAGIPALNAGVIVNRGTSTNTFLRWNEVTDRWGWSDDGTTFYNLDTSLSAYSQANAAYGAANNRVLKAGDTMTGQLNISSGGLLVTGSVGIGTTNPATTLHVDASGGGIVRVSRLGAGAGILQLEADGTDGAISSTNNTRFQTNSTERMRITTGGNVGIATTNPGQLLDVVGANSSNAWARILGGAGTTSGGLIVGNNDSSKEYGRLFWNNASNDLVLSQEYTSGSLIFRTNTTECVRILNGGSVGIGTTNPLYKLDVSIGSTDGVNGTVANSYPVALFTNRSSGGGNRGFEIGAPTGSVASPVYIKVYATSARFSILNNANTEQFTILNSGNVGIATTNPTTLFSVGSNPHTSPSNTDRILNWYSTTGGTELWNSVTGITIGNNSSATDQPQYVGISLFNRNSTDNIWSPALTFGGLSTSGSYMNGAAAIAVKMPANSDDANFRSGDLHFFTQGAINGTKGLSSNLVLKGSGNIYTTYGSPISYGSGETYEIWSDDSEYIIAHSDANWKDMKTFVCSKSGNLKFKFSGYISSGTYYWAWRILSNGSTVVASGNYSVGLDTGEVTSVHAYRRFVASVGPVAAGDSLVLQMVSSTGGGTPVTGVGQSLVVKEFRAYSTVPVGGPDNSRSLNVFGTNGSRGLTRKFDSGKYYYSDFKLLGSAFDNPVQSLVTLPASGQTNSTMMIRITVTQVGYAGGGGNVHEGGAHAMWTGSAWSLYADTMVKRVGQLTNVGTLSWSGNTLQYTCNRVSNYDNYYVTLEVIQPASFVLPIYHI